ERARTRWPWLTLLGVEGWRRRVAPDDPRHGFSLVRDDLTPRPVLQALRAGMASAPLRTGFNPLADAGLDGTGSPLTVAARFTGTGIALAARSPSQVGAPTAFDLEWSVDGGPRRLLRRSAPVCASCPDSAERRIILAEGLAPAEHRLGL